MMILIGQLATMLIIGLVAWCDINFIFWGLWHGLGLFLQNRWSDFAKNRFTDTNNPRLQSALQIGGVIVSPFTSLPWDGCSLH